MAGGGYYVKMGYAYNKIDKIVSNPVQYNIDAPNVVSYLLSQVHDCTVSDLRIADRLVNQSFTNKYSYDGLGRMTNTDIFGINPNVFIANLDWIIRHTSFSNIDANGNPLSQTMIDNEEDIYKSTTTLNSRCNYLNQMTSQSGSWSSTDPYATSYSWTSTVKYDNNGNKLSETYSGESPARTNSKFIYGLDNQLLWSVVDSHHTMGGDDLDIDCHVQTTNSYTYELGGRLLKVGSAVSDSSSPYDVWNENYKDYYYYSHDGVVAELHDDIGRFKYFTRLGRELLACNNNGSTYFYIQNIRGDVIMLVNSNGKVASIRDYDVTGQVLCNAPDVRTDRDPFGFTGGLDAGNGLLKLGARFYDSSKNGFIQQDRYMGDPSDPLSLNRYVYCGLDPINYVDPTGFSGILTIYSVRADNPLSSGLSYGGHSWIGYTHESGKTFMWGTWGHDIGGPKGLRNDTQAEFDLASEAVSRSTWISDFQEAYLMTIISDYQNMGEDAWSMWNPCSDFATDVWGYVTGEHLEDRGLDGFGYSDPNVVADSIENANNSDSAGSSGDKIICVELFRQGLMNKKIFEADEAFGRMLRKKYPVILIGYQWWAKPIVKHMKKSKTFTRAIYFITKPWSYEMAYQMGKRNRGNLEGKFLMYTGFIICWVIGFVLLNKILIIALIPIIIISCFLLFYKWNLLKYYKKLLMEGYKEHNHLKI